MIKFLQINLDGYLNKEPQLIQLAQKYQIDIFIISELKRSHYDSNAPTLELPGFTTHQRNYRTAILYRNDLNFKVTPFFLHTENHFNYFNENQFVHSSSLLITDRKTKKTLEVHSVYRPNSKNKHKLHRPNAKNKLLPNNCSSFWGDLKTGQTRSSS